MKALLDNIFLKNTAISNVHNARFVLLVCIILLAFFLRVHNLTTNPPELFSDELINITSAKSIIETGSDLHGKLYVYFSDRVEMRPPIYGYSAYIATRIFGESAFGIRLPAVFFGVVTVVLLYALAEELTKNTELALIAAFILAILPWHVHYSRIGWEPAALLPFLLGGIYFLYKGIQADRKRLITIGIVLMGLAIYTYQAAPLYSVLFTTLIIFLFRSYFFTKTKFFVQCLLIYGLLLLPHIISSQTQPELLDRAQRIFTFASGINMQTIEIFFQNYFVHYGLHFLFYNGDPNLRHGAQTGVLYWWMLPFIIIGSLCVGKIVYKKSHAIFIYTWLAYFPLAAALTNDGVPHATRSLIGAPLFCLLTAIGLYYTCKSISSRKIALLLFYCVLVIILELSLFRFLKMYYLTYPIISASSWDYGHRPTFMKVQALEADYDRVCLGTLGYTNSKQLIRHYLARSTLEVIEGIDSPACQLKQTIITLPATTPAPNNAHLRDIVYDQNSDPKYAIYTID